MSNKSINARYENSSSKHPDWNLDPCNPSIHEIYRIYREYGNYSISHPPLYMLCFWDDCYLYLDTNDILEHLREHVGYIRDYSFHPRCKWKSCTIKKNTRSRMISHLTSHVDVRNFKCNFCYKYFKRKCDLSYHIQSCKIANKQKRFSFEEAVALLFEKDSNVNKIY